MMGWLDNILKWLIKYVYIIQSELKNVISSIFADFEVQTTSEHVCFSLYIFFNLSSILINEIAIKQIPYWFSRISVQSTFGVPMLIKTVGITFMHMYIHVRIIDYTEIKVGTDNAPLETFNVAFLPLLFTACNNTHLVQIVSNHLAQHIQAPCRPWYLYQMVTQNMLRTHEGKYVFSKEKKTLWNCS